MVYNSYPKLNLPNAGTSIPDYLDRLEQAPSLESLAIVGVRERNLAGDGASQRVRVAGASASLFEVLRASPAFGRAFTVDEETCVADNVDDPLRPGRNEVTVLFRGQHAAAHQ